MCVCVCVCVLFYSYLLLHLPQSFRIYLSIYLSIIKKHALGLYYYKGKSVNSK